jgi:hypothetical protein
VAVFKAVIDELKFDVPVPSLVLPVFVPVVGFVLVCHTIPFAVIEAPPSLIVFPPDDAEFFVIFVIAVVLIVGGATEL